MLNAQDLADSIVDVCHKLALMGMACANGGNVSVRLAEDRVLITPSGVCLRDVNAGELVTVDMSGKKRLGSGTPSIETMSHTAFYGERPDVKAIIHCHPPSAVAWALARKLPPLESFCEGFFLVGEVRLVDPYVTPEEQPAVVGENARDVNGLLLSNHGLLMAGPDLRMALLRVETYELLCCAALAATNLGGAQRIEAEPLAWLQALHKQHFGG